MANISFSKTTNEEINFGTDIRKQLSSRLKQGDNVSLVYEEEGKQLSLTNCVWHGVLISQDTILVEYQDKGAITIEFRHIIRIEVEEWL